MKTEQFDYADENKWPMIDLRMHVADLSMEQESAPTPRKFDELTYVLGHAGIELFYRTHRDVMTEVI